MVHSRRFIHPAAELMKPGLILSSKFSNKEGCWQILRSCINPLLRPFTPPDFHHWDDIGMILNE